MKTTMLVTINHRCFEVGGWWHWWVTGEYVTLTEYGTSWTHGLMHVKDKRVARTSPGPDKGGSGDLSKVSDKM